MTLEEMDCLIRAEQERKKYCTTRKVSTRTRATFQSEPKLVNNQQAIRSLVKTTKEVAGRKEIVDTADSTAASEEFAYGDYKN